METGLRWFWSAGGGRDTDFQADRGRFESGERVAVIEDVVNDGGDFAALAQVLRRCRPRGISLVVVLDRGEGGEENIARRAIP